MEHTVIFELPLYFFNDGSGFPMFIGHKGIEVEFIEGCVKRIQIICQIVIYQQAIETISVQYFVLYPQSYFCHFQVKRHNP